MVDIKTQDGNWVITIPKEKIGAPFVLRFLERLEYENTIKNNQMTAEQAEELSEAIKADWWQANRERILAKMREA